MNIRILILGIVGPAMALCATWYETVRIARIGANASVSLELVEPLRKVPSDSVLNEMNEFARGVTTFDDLEPELVVAKAEEVFKGRFDYYGEVQAVNVPFRASDDLLGSSTWHLRLNSLLIPGLLARAFEVSGDEKYLRAAVDYIVDWESFESSLLIAHDPVFNDHATAARAIVVTNVWRLYRSSEIFSIHEAAKLLSYVAKLSRLLRDNRLYQYRSNHGLMQNLALLHIAVAFPVFHETGQNITVGKNRLLSQLVYYLNTEGVILEHSTGYHHQFLTGLSAAWRYLALLGISVPPEMAERYRRAFRFDKNMVRPDGTLPPIGDTRDVPYGPVRIAPLNDDLIASPLMQAAASEASIPEPSFVAPVAGYAVFWDGLENWPDVNRLSQTALAWANFTGDSHKHADELSVTIWAGGDQWVRGIGYWPYVASRIAAVGWRSTNAPHWLDESASEERSSFLTGIVTDESLAFLDIMRRNTNGRTVRRQTIILHDGTWIVLDDFESQNSDAVEVIWQFSPELTLEQIGTQRFVVATSSSKKSMTVQFELPVESKIEADIDGRVNWNNGVASGYEIVLAPAIRVISDARRPVLKTVFRLHDKMELNAEEQSESFIWHTPERWILVLDSGSTQETTIQRRGDRLDIIRAGTILSRNIVAQNEDEVQTSRQEAVDAFEQASKHYGKPFGPATERRSKLTMAIITVALAQMLFFVMIPANWLGWRKAIEIASLVGWVAVSLFIGLNFVA